MIPHPDKVEKGGEDAYFVSSDGKAIGIADGVGGWVMHGVDPSIYSNCLMQSSKKAYENLNIKDPVHVLNYAYKTAEPIPGSSTACVGVIQDNKLKCLNLGDSGFMVVRSGSILFRTKEQQHVFNFPVQLGTGHTTTPDDGDQIHVDVHDGDIVIMATDGLFDNLYDNEILDIVNYYTKLTGKDELNLAEMLASTAHQRAKAGNIETPFNRHAFDLGYLDSPIGGKMDDITVLAAFVTPNGAAEEPTTIRHITH